MNSPLFGFSSKLLFSLSFAFCLHLFLLHKYELPLFENKIILAYLLNFFLAIFIFGGLYLFRKKYLSILGFLFMGGSFLKFTLFFIFFYPSFKQNGNVDASEATSFLIPYLISLLLETFYLSKLLNKQV